MGNIVQGRPDTSKPLRQCGTCPFRASVVPARDVPDFAPGIEARIVASMRSGNESMTEKERMVMACHKDTPGIICAGWLHHQLNQGNNLAARINVMTKRWPVPIVVGKQRDFKREAERETEKPAKSKAPSSARPRRAR